MSADLSEFLQSPKVNRCKLGAAYDEMTPEQQEKLTDALALKAVSAERIASVVTGWGWPVSETVARGHRTKRCCCD